ncbi:MAG: molybdenum cofactor biosynthesis protein MoaE [Microthrixaceae bacterium]
MLAPDGDNWLSLTDEILDPTSAAEWVCRPDCGAVVCFTGYVRDHHGERLGVERLTYEAYSRFVVAVFAEIVDEVRGRWPALGRIAVVHRTGVLTVGEAAVTVAVSAPHRVDAFAAACHTIDAVKARAPVWKCEEWSRGREWVGAE